MLLRLPIGRVARVELRSLAGRVEHMHSTRRSALVRISGCKLSPSTAFTITFVLGATVMVLLTLAFPAAALVAGAWVAMGLAIRALGPLAVSPVVIVAAGLALVAVAGWLLYPLVVDVQFATGIQLPASPELLDRGFYALTAASLMVSVGAIAVGVFSRRPGGRMRLHPVQIPKNIRALLVVGVPLPTLALIALRGPGSLLERGIYLPRDDAGGLAGLLSSGLVVTIVLSGYLLHTQRKSWWIVVGANVVLSTGFLIASGSRLFAAIPALLAVGYYLARMDRRALLMLGFGTIAALFLVPLPLYWRSLELHGLIPYFSALSGYFETDFGLATTAKTILISVPITGATATADLPSGALLTALDPRGGEAAGWYAIASQMRLNRYSPMSGVGELLNHGSVVLALFFLAAGGYLGLLDRHVRRALTRGHQLVAFAHIGLISLFLVYLIQYNLRSSMRMLYYSAALLVIYQLWVWAQSRSTSTGVFRNNKHLYAKTVPNRWQVQSVV